MLNIQSTTPATQGFPTLSTDALRELIRDWDQSRSSAELISAMEEACSHQRLANARAVKPTNNRGGKSMSRRKGQYGAIEEHGEYYTLRLWMDVEGQEKRVHVRVKICPRKRGSPGWLNASERQNRAKEIVDKLRVNSPERFREVVRQTNTRERTFREQSEIFVQNLWARAEAREKSGADSTASGSASTADNWEGCLRNWLIPMLGDLPLSKVNNGALKRVVAWMKTGGPMPRAENGKKVKYE